MTALKKNWNKKIEKIRIKAEDDAIKAFVELSLYDLKQMNNLIVDEMDRLKEVEGDNKFAVAALLYIDLLRTIKKAISELSPDSTDMVLN